MNCKFNMIVAMDEERGIGRKNTIPWPMDMFYSKKTMGKQLFCGRITYEGLPEVYKKKTKITVLMRNEKQTVSGYVIGGAQIYNAYIMDPNLRYIYVTLIPGRHECDAFFPEIPQHFILKSTKKVGRFWIQKHANISIDFDYLALARKCTPQGITAQISYTIIPKFVNTNLIEASSILNENTNLIESVEYLLPIITTKRVFIRGVIEELLFFLRGETDTKILENKGINIWKANTTREWLDSRELFDYPEGEGGPIYGYQWSKQWPYIFDELKRNPSSRRALISAWIPEDLPKMCLPPCHVSYQFLLQNDKLNIIVYQRSADVFLGLPFNLASTGFMNIIMSQHLSKLLEKTIMPGTVTICIGNAHVYQEHVEAVQKQLQNNVHLPATVSLAPFEDFRKIQFEDFKISYTSCSAIKAPIIAIN